MAFATPKTTSGTATLTRLGKFVVGGETVLITGLGGYGNGVRTRRKPPGATPDTYYPFSQLNPSTLQPEWGAGVSVDIQYKADTEEKSQLVNADDGPGMPETYLIGYLLDADTTSRCPQIRLVLQDVARALMMPDLYTVAGITVAAQTTAQQDAGEPGSGTETPTALTCLKVDLSDQLEDTGSGPRLCGNACIVVNRSVTEAQIKAFDYIKVTGPGGIVVKYTLWNEKGVRPLQTYHYALMLQRMPG